jgi:hypothetical protein
VHHIIRSNDVVEGLADGDERGAVQRHVPRLVDQKCFARSAGERAVLPRPFAIEHDKLPGLLINGSLKQQFMMQVLKDWVGPSGWVWKVSFQFRAMNLVGETIRVWGKVIDVRRTADFGLVDLELGILNDHDKESTPGSGTVALPYRGGKPLPYPFVAPAA